MSSRSQRREAVEAAEQTGMDPAVLAATASVMLSWYYFFARQNRDLGLFVGMWPPTIFAFVSYFKQTRMSDRIERAAGSNQGNIMGSVQRMMRNR